jgi:hypothetical protein
MYIYDGLVDGTVGQFGFRLTPPLNPLPRTFFPTNLTIRSAQATRAQAPVTTDSVLVVASINGVEHQRGRVLVASVNETVRILAEQRFLHLDELGRSANFLLQIEAPKQATSGRYNWDIINRALAALGFQQIGVPGTPMIPTQPFVFPRYAQVRSRGGFATLFGAAAGYALGGLPGAAVGAAVSLLR